MREILFRGKRVDDGSWIFGNCVLQGCRIFIDINISQMFDTAFFENHNFKEVIPETVGQFTGLTDKNGERIFEGDIVKGAWGTVFVVYYDECYFQFRAKKADSYAREIDYYGDSNEIEIIGNIHDNPELLK
jgi:uncharacterized phage protein (TIGR01671 family)